MPISYPITGSSSDLGGGTKPVRIAIDLLPLPLQYAVFGLSILYSKSPR